MLVINKCGFLKFTLFLKGVCGVGGSIVVINLQVAFDGGVYYHRRVASEWLLK
jgi:hypothetical protein